MGAWGTDTFDNDTACDWAYGLEGVDTLAPLERAIEEVLRVGSAYLDADVACQALAACEVIARLKGNYGARNVYTESVDAWVAAHPGAPPADLIDRALAALDRVLVEPSELFELWAETEEYVQWRSAVSDLRSRTAADKRT